MERLAVDECGGFIFMYADNHLTRPQFDRMYRTYSAKYEGVRSRLPDCGRAFPHVYDKISSKGRAHFC